MSHITINDLIEYDDRRLGLTLLAGKSGIKSTIEHPKILICNTHESEFREKIKDETILIFPQASISGKEKSPLREREDFLNRINTSKILLIILSEAKGAPDFLLQLSEESDIPLLCTENSSALIESGLMGILRREIEGKVDIHGVLMDINGIGVIIKGESGIGKSECGLELITRGHKLIADDIIEVEKTGENILCGRSSELTRNYMEIRGLGIVDIKSLFGIAAVGGAIDIGIVVDLIRWENGMEFNRIDSEGGSFEILGVSLPRIRIPVRSGGNMATVVEIVARNFILKTKGCSPSREREERILDKTKRGGVH
jgi:HPr kinase/phosphorylase